MEGRDGRDRGMGPPARAGSHGRPVPDDDGRDSGSMTELPAPTGPPPGAGTPTGVGPPPPAATPAPAANPRGRGPPAPPEPAPPPISPAVRNLHEWAKGYVRKFGWAVAPVWLPVDQVPGAAAAGLAGCCC